MIVIAVAFINIRKWIVRSKRRAYLKDRETLSISEIYDRFYRGRNIPEEAFCTAWSAIAKALGTNPGQLRPDDKLSNLKAWDDHQPLESNLEYLVMDNLLGKNNLPEKLDTIDQVVKLTANK